MSKMDWVDEREEVLKKESVEGYFDIQEGNNRIQLLTHCAPLPLIWTGTKYRPAESGETGVSIKGVCWILQEGKIKQAKLAYTVVKSIRELQKDPDYSFDEFPMPRLINIKAKNAGTKEVEYTVIPSPKEIKVPKEIIDELATKPTPEEIVEKEKSKIFQVPKKVPISDETDPSEIPF